MEAIGSPPSGHTHTLLGVKYLFLVQAEVGGDNPDNHFLLPLCWVRELELVSSQGQSHGGSHVGPGSGPTSPFLPSPLSGLCSSRHFDIRHLFLIDPHSKLCPEPDDTTLINQ